MVEGTALAVMARYPVVGEVKTRLAHAIGAEAAYQLYRAFLRDIEERFGNGRHTLVWVFDPPDCDFAAIVGPGARCLPQRGDHLAERMLNCFRTLREEGFERIIMIGADVPHAQEEWLDEAEARLAEVDVVLGPSTDGGYYLVAMTKPHDLFTGVEMSTPQVLAQTVHRAALRNLQVHLLPVAFDIDQAGDLALLRLFLEDRERNVSLTHTGALLKGLKRGD